MAKLVGCGLIFNQERRASGALLGNVFGDMAPLFMSYLVVAEGLESFLAAHAHKLY